MHTNLLCTQYNPGNHDRAGGILSKASIIKDSSLIVHKPVLTGIKWCTGLTDQASIKVAQII